MENHVENSYIKMYIKDDILYGEYAKGLKITLEIAKECVDLRLTLTKDKNYLTIVDVSQIDSTSKEARDYYATEEAIAGLKILAIITDSTVTKVIGNFYININKPPIPSKLFTSQEAALKWIKNFQESI